MRKLYLSLIILFAGTLSYGQAILFSENFANFDSLSSANYNGWTLTYTGFSAYYTSSFSSGPSGPNSYKFGKDSATATTPMFSNQADSIHFWMRGNTASGGTMAQSALYIYESPDGTNWSLLYLMAPPISLSPATIDLGLSPGTVQVRFFYDKDTGNVAFDDFTVTSSTVGVNEVSLDKKVKVFPSPASTKLNVHFGSVVNNADVSVFNVIGKEMHHVIVDHPSDNVTLNVAGFTEGVYLVKVKADQQTITRRVVVRH